MIDGTESSSFGFSHATGHVTPIHSHIGDIFSPKDAQETPPAFLATSSSQPIDRMVSSPGTAKRQTVVGGTPRTHE